MLSTAEHIQHATETFDECKRLMSSGKTQAGIRYLMRCWRDIPADIQQRFLAEDFLLLPHDTQQAMQDILLSQSREAGITQRTAALRQQMRTDRVETVRLEEADACRHAARSTRRKCLTAMATVLALAALVTLYYSS